ncbi:MAG: hypothetical protein M1537_09120 [Nitrospirae bacterium]|nr:MAG: hypothetical protein D084_Lepto4C00384G0005 [Leptospirillum sp. Group IV 'UBA BS']MCL4486465.1 hypothetical protein [Nitrospirota bacterium]MCL5284889.1 hypothetical protein [Nitrospirota bacterium]
MDPCPTGPPPKSFIRLRGGFVAGLLLFLFLSFPAPGQALAADDFSCDSLESVTPREGTVWSWFDHPCPPSPEEESPAILPGVGVTLQGFWIPTTLYNPTGTPVSQNLPLINNQVENGYGGGLEITGWLAQNLAVRFQADVWTFPPQAGQYAVSMLPILLGLEVKVLGGNRVYLYVAADGGAAFNGQKVSNVFSGTSLSPYAQAAVGLNFYFLQFEASYGILMNPLQSGASGMTGTGGKTNPFFIVPLTLGIHL